jgi:Tfp pilus assembly protein PilN
MKHDINLYQPHRGARVPVPLRRWAALALLCFTALGALWYAQLAGETAALAASVARAQADAARVSHQTERLPQVLQRETEQVNAIEAEVLALEALADRLTRGGLGRVEGFAPQLRAFGRATADGVWLTGIRIDNAGDQLAVEGRALEAARVPHLLAALGREPAFAGRAFATLELKSADDAGRGAMPVDAVKFRVASAKTEGAPR